VNTRSLRPYAKPLLLVAGLAIAGITLNHLHFRDLRQHALMRPDDILAFVAMAALACGVGMPRQVVAFAAGYGWGIAAGTGLALAAQIIGCIGNFFWARLIARDFVQRSLRGRVARFDRFLAGNPFTATLMLRLMPVGNNLLLNLAAGVSAIRPAPFFLGSALGYVPQTVIFALLGSGSRLDRGTTIGISAVLLLISILLGIVLVRRLRAPAPLV